MLPMQKNWNRDKTAKGLMLLSAFAFGLLIPGRFSVTTTPSLTHRIYLISRISDAREIKKGSYLLFSMAHTYANNGQAREAVRRATAGLKKGYRVTTSIPVMKMARCMPGDHLKTLDRLYYCNGEFLGWAKEYSLKGERVENFVYDGVVPTGNIFVMGEHKDSFDSRYFGFIEAMDVAAIGHPVY
ncbi:MAG: Peptidase S26 [Syntrophorhabdus sp. PtaU1.Bin050]|nr:MAG: Peptidase S26 [Syntrophorhabdus sp. PtaU1.Bin050]